MNLQNFRKESKKMKMRTKFAMAVGFVAGAAAGAVGAMAYDKIAAEIKSDMSEQTFTSPEGNNVVTVSYGSSATAKGLTYVRVKALNSEDGCKLVAFAKKSPDMLNAEWLDNNSFKLLIGNGKHKQCCDVKFDEANVTANYYLVKSH
jgi:hypothetical protein